MAEIVYTSRQFCDILKHIATQLNTKYDNHFPRNLGYNYGGGYSWDCWNLPKSLISLTLHSIELMHARRAFLSSPSFAC